MVVKRALSTVITLTAAACAACAALTQGPSTGASPTENPSPTANASPTSPASPSSSPTAGASPGIVANCPATISNVSGAYSFACTTGWKYVNCEKTASTLPYTWLINPQGCLLEAYGLRMMVWSMLGDQSAAPENGQVAYVGQRQ